MLDIDILEENRSIELIKDESAYIYYKMAHKSRSGSFIKLDSSIKSGYTNYPFFIELEEDSWGDYYWSAITKEDIENHIKFDMAEQRKFLDKCLQEIENLDKPPVA
jgi:hypothetical protein